VNWAQEIREAIEERLKQLEAEENFKVVLQELENAKWSMPKGFSAASVREDRDSG
jgi:predicted metallopeptidase